MGKDKRKGKPADDEIKSNSYRTAIQELQDPFKRKFTISKPAGFDLGTAAVGSMTQENFEELVSELWVERFYRMNKSINVFIHEKYTKEISNFIPLNILKQLIRTYRLLNKISGEKFIGNEDWLKKMLKQIFNNIDKIQKRRWLKKSDAKEIKENIFVESFESPKGLSFIMNFLKPQTGKIGSPKNISFDALIYCIICQLKRATGKPNYKLVVDFLAEQNLINPETEDVKGDEEVLRKRYKRIKLSSLKDQYDALRTSFLGTLFLSQRATYDTKLADQLIPPLEKFIDT